MEGTLLRSNRTLDNGKVAPSAWTVLAKAIGEECYQEEEKTKDTWNSDGYRNYMDWMIDTVRIHRKYGLKKDLFEKILNGVEPTPGTIETFQVFRDWGAVTVLISGGIKFLADRVQRQLKIDHSLSGCEYFFDDNGLIQHINVLPSDNEGKVDFMKLLEREYSVSRQDCAFIGDGKNDVSLAKAVGCSVAFNAQQELKEVVSIVIEQPDGQEHFGAVVTEIEKWRPKCQALQLLQRFAPRAR